MKRPLDDGDESSDSSDPSLLLPGASLVTKKAYVDASGGAGGTHDFDVAVARANDSRGTLEALESSGSGSVEDWVDVGDEKSAPLRRSPAPNETGVPGIRTLLFSEVVCDLTVPEAVQGALEGFPVGEDQDVSVILGALGEMDVRTAAHVMGGVVPAAVTEWLVSLVVRSVAHSATAEACLRGWISRATGAQLVFPSMQRWAEWLGTFERPGGGEVPAVAAEAGNDAREACFFRLCKLLYDTLRREIALEGDHDRFMDVPVTTGGDAERIDLMVSLLGCRLDCVAAPVRGVIDATLKLLFAGAPLPAVERDLLWTRVREYAGRRLPMQGGHRAQRGGPGNLPPEVSPSDRHAVMLGCVAGVPTLGVDGVCLGLAVQRWMALQVAGDALAQMGVGVGEVVWAGDEDEGFAPCVIAWWRGLVEVLGEHAPTRDGGVEEFVEEHERRLAGGDAERDDDGDDEGEEEEGGGLALASLILGALLALRMHIRPGRARGELTEELEGLGKELEGELRRLFHWRSLSGIRILSMLSKVVTTKF